MDLNLLDEILESFCKLYPLTTLLNKDYLDIKVFFDYTFKDETYTATVYNKLNQLNGSLHRQLTIKLIGSLKRKSCHSNGWFLKEKILDEMKFLKTLKNELKSDIVFHIKHKAIDIKFYEKDTKSKPFLLVTFEPGFPVYDDTLLRF